MTLGWYYITVFTDPVDILDQNYVASVATLS